MYTKEKEPKRKTRGISCIYVKQVPLNTKFLAGPQFCIRFSPTNKIYQEQHRMFPQVGWSDRTKAGIHSSVPHSAVLQLPVCPSNGRRCYHSVFTPVLSNSPITKPQLSLLYFICVCVSHSVHRCLCTPWLMSSSFSYVSHSFAGNLYDDNDRCQMIMNSEWRRVQCSWLTVWGSSRIGLYSCSVIWRSVYWYIDTNMFITTTVTMTWYRRLVVELSPQRPGLNSRPVCVGYVVDKLRLEQGFIRVLQFSSVTVFHQCSTLIHPSRKQYNLSGWEYS